MDASIFLREEKDLSMFFTELIDLVGNPHIIEAVPFQLFHSAFSVKLNRLQAAAAFALLQSGLSDALEAHPMAAGPFNLL